MSVEIPPKLSQKDIEEQRDSRATDLIIDGAGYVKDENGSGRLELTADQIEEARAEAKAAEAHKEKLEREKLFQSQIENNSHPRAKLMKENLILFIDSLERDNYNTSSDKFQLLKDELSEVLYRNDIEYAEGKVIEINEEDKGIVQPILDFRKEMDALNPLDTSALADYKERLLGYMGDTFGVESYKPKEGDTVDRRTTKVTKVHGTGVSLLNQRIKKVGRSGYKFNDEFLEYYKKSQTNNLQEMRGKWISLKGTISDEEISKIIDKDQKTLDKYSFPTGTIRPANVETYSSTAHAEATEAEGKAVPSSPTLDDVRSTFESRCKTRFPNDLEELYRNFDKYVPKEIGGVTGIWAGADGIAWAINGKTFKHLIEKELYGVTIDGVGQYFSDQEKHFVSRMAEKEAAEFSRLHEQIQSGDLENPLRYIESEIGSELTSESEKDSLRVFAERLSAEIYKDIPKDSVNIGDVKREIEKEKAHSSDGDNTEHFNAVLAGLDKGDMTLAYEETEFKIERIYRLLKDGENEDRREISEKLLKELYGEDLNQALQDLRMQRRFLKNEINTQNEKSASGAQSSEAVIEDGASQQQRTTEMGSTTDPTMDMHRNESDEERRLREEVNRAVTDLPPEERKKIGLGLRNVGFFIEEWKSRNLASVCGKLVSDKQPESVKRFLSSLAETYKKDEKSARERIENRETSGGAMQRVQNVGYVTGNLMKYGRTVADIAGWTAGSPLRYVMAGAQFFSRGAEAAKEARLQNEVVKEKRLVQNEGEAAEEAWKIYEMAASKCEAGEIKKADLDKAYTDNLPEDLLNRLKRSEAGTASGMVSKFGQFILRKDIEFALKHGKFSETSFKKRLEEFDRIVGHYGTVDSLAMGARYAETGGKAVVAGVQLETAYLLVKSLPEMVERIFGAAGVSVPGHTVVAPSGPSAPHVLEPDTQPVPKMSKMPVISVEASGGHGYEYMMKRMWEQLQDKGLVASQYPEGSDIRQLLDADASSIDKVVHQLASDSDHGFFNADGTSVQIDPGAHMTIDAHGRINLGNAMHAPEDAATTPAYRPEEPGAQEEDVTQQQLEQDLATQESDATSKERREKLKEIIDKFLNPTETPSDENVKETIHKFFNPAETPSDAQVHTTYEIPTHPAPTPEVAKELPSNADTVSHETPGKFYNTQPQPPIEGPTTSASPKPETSHVPAPETSHYIVNTHEISVDPDHANAYFNSRGETVIFGGSLDEMANKASELVEKDHSAVVYFSKKPDGILSFLRGPIIGRTVWLEGHGILTQNNIDTPQLNGWNIPTADDLTEVYKPEEKIDFSQVRAAPMPLVHAGPDDIPRANMPSAGPGDGFDRP